jgi:putative ABC transport system permease protein
VPAFTRDDADAVRKQLAPMINGCSEVTQYPTVAKNGSVTHNSVFAGGVEEVFRIRRWKLAAGRFYNDHDVKSQSPVAILGATVARELFPNVRPEDIVGQRMRAGGLQFQIIGILQAKGATPAGDQDDVIMVPITTLLRRVTGGNKCLLVLVEARSSSLVPKVKADMERILRVRHHIRPGEEADFHVKSMREYADLALIFANTLSGLIFAIASVSLVVGGIGVMNIMLVSVTERTREIGIRMAVGAKTTDILGQFLTEAVILALVGGGIGITLGAACAWAIAYIANWELLISPAAVLVAVATSAAVGIFFGYYPARKASLLDPIDALRYE